MFPACPPHLECMSRQLGQPIPLSPVTAPHQFRNTAGFVQSVRRLQTFTVKQVPATQRMQCGSQSSVKVQSQPQRRQRSAEKTTRYVSSCEPNHIVVFLTVTVGYLRGRSCGHPSTTFYEWQGLFFYGSCIPAWKIYISSASAAGKFKI